MQETADTIIKAITPLAEKIGEGASHLYQVYVKQMHYEGIIDLVTIFIIFVITFVVIKVALKMINRNENSKGYNDALETKAFISIVAMILLIIASIISLFGIQPSVTQLVNPEYHAVQRIIDQVTPESEN